MLVPPIPLTPKWSLTYAPTDSQRVLSPHQ